MGRDGTGFNLVPTNPYTLPVGTDATPCTFVSPERIQALYGSLTWNSYLGGFVLVGTLIMLPAVLGYTWWSYSVFRGKVTAESGYH